RLSALPESFFVGRIAEETLTHPPEPHHYCGDDQYHRHAPHVCAGKNEGDRHSKNSRSGPVAYPDNLHHAGFGNRDGGHFPGKYSRVGVLYPSIEIPYYFPSVRYLLHEQCPGSPERAKFSRGDRHRVFPLSG